LRLSLLGLGHQYLFAPICFARLETDTIQMTIPFMDFLLKEITVEAFLAYTNEDSRDTVEAFAAGELDQLTRRILIFIGD
jgi:hypothetical protein